MDTNSEFIVFGAPQIGQQEIDEVVDSLKKGWLGTGPKVKRFEEAFSKYKGLSENRSIAVNSCTAALHLSLIASGVGPGDEVITTSLTFCATVNAIVHTGATPVLADIDPATLNINVESIKSKITERTKAIVPVHFAGLMCDMAKIMDVAKKHNLFVIEDCAHAIESESPEGKAGTIGDLGCFSFYVTKNLATGEGGMIISQKLENNDRLKRLALHGMSADAWSRFSDDGYKHYQVVECGFKYNMMDIQAAIGIHQLARIEQNWQRRKQIFEYYNSRFQALDISLPVEPPTGYRHAHHLYTITLNSNAVTRDKMLIELHKKNIGAGVHYLSIPEHPFYQKTYGWNIDDYPVAKRIGRNILSIPLSAKITDQQIEYIADSVIHLLS